VLGWAHRTARHVVFGGPHAPATAQALRGRTSPARESLEFAFGLFHVDGPPRALPALVPAGGVLVFRVGAAERGRASLAEHHRSDPHPRSATAADRTAAANGSSPTRATATDGTTAPTTDAATGDKTSSDFAAEAR